jgi:regulator of sirC expression with transglutaminase-like and TPR domain
MHLEKLDAALADINKAISLSPVDAPIIFFRGQVYEKLGKKREAVKDISKALKLGLSDDMTRTARKMLQDIKKR